MTPRSIDLTCREAVEMVTEYLSRALVAEERVRFEKHLLTCPPCTAYLGQMVATSEMAARLGAAPPAGQVDENLVDLFRRWRKS